MFTFQNLVRGVQQRMKSAIAEEIRVEYNNFIDMVSLSIPKEETIDGKPTGTNTIDNTAGAKTEIVDSNADFPTDDSYVGATVTMDSKTSVIESNTSTKLTMEDDTLKSILLGNTYTIATNTNIIHLPKDNLQVLDVKVDDTPMILMLSYKEWDSEKYSSNYRCLATTDNRLLFPIAIDLTSSTLTIRHYAMLDDKITSVDKDTRIELHDKYLQLAKAFILRELYTYENHSNGDMFAFWSRRYDDLESDIKGMTETPYVLNYGTIMVQQSFPTDYNDQV